jgi:hypothetical protein
MKLVRYSIAAALAIAPVAGLGHHGWSSYDQTRPLTVNGTFKSVAWANPHGTARIQWQGKEWAVILAPIGRMEARGLSEAMIAPGKRVTLTGYARSDGTPEMRIERIKAGEKTVELR